MDKQTQQEWYEDFCTHYLETYPEEYWTYWCQQTIEQIEESALDVPF